jgi:hypothetical protein
MAVPARNLTRIAGSPDGVALASAAGGSRNVESEVFAVRSGDVGPMRDNTELCRGVATACRCGRA